MRIKNMTLEELEALETKLYDAVEEKNLSLNRQKTLVYEEMYKRVRKLVREDKEDKDYLENIKKQLVLHLIVYGSYLKMEYQKDDQLAMECLKKALYYDKRIPIASYRLGFLSYKHKNYQEALYYFQKALENQKDYKDKKLQLNEKQVVNAHLYLTNSALYIAKQTHDQFKSLKIDTEQSVPNYEFSELYSSLIDNENYLNRNAFYKITEEDTTTCSKEECENFILYPPKNTIILYFSDRNIQLIFNEEVEQLPQTRGDVLKHLLSNSSSIKPTTRSALRNYFPNGLAHGEISLDYFRQVIKRVREHLRNCAIPEIIINTSYQNETSYYFNQSLPFIVLYRVDEEIHL